MIEEIKICVMAFFESFMAEVSFKNRQKNGSSFVKGDQLYLE